MSFDFTILQWTILILSAMLIGMSKVGVPGVSLIVIPALAMIFGGKPSTGVLLPMLILADIFGVTYYHRHADWKNLIRMFPWALGGLFLGVWIGDIVNEYWFKKIISVLVFLSLGLMLRKRKESLNYPNRWWFAPLMGILGGFATMMGNVAGPVFAIYLLAMDLPKSRFIGTTAWFFLVINFTKFPLQMFVWNNIKVDYILINLLLLPAIGIGAYLGIHLVKRIPEQSYRTFVILITGVSAFLLLL
ncbi:uncharacterized membrane protein YfcA [Bacteroidales bacterium 6E]|nr:uncharacterized membrane protein YfcA [Bacteroidales bacterium 6E]